MKNNSTQILRLLPNYFKKIGFILFLGSLIFIISTINSLVTYPKNIDFIRLISFDITILSMLIMAMSKEKIEDELTQHIRLRSFAAAFICGVVTFIIKPLTSYIFFDKYNNFDIQGGEIVTFMFIVYFIVFYDNLKLLNKK